MKRTSAAAAVERGLARARRRAEAATRTARAGIVQVLTTPDPPPVWRGPWRRRLAYAAVGTATVLLGLTALTGLNDGLGFVLSVRVALMVTATGLIIRDPLLSWRLAWLALVLSVAFSNPVLDIRPWHAVELPVLVAAFCVAGARRGRQMIW
jgi:hypothetical protein